MPRINVLVYTGTGTTVESVRHTIYTLRRLLSPHFAVNPITAHTLLTEPWSPTCALLVLPGGADLGYCRALNGDGNRLISQYVWGGGAYLGFCAGGYYGCNRVEFEVGDSALEVVGPRELAFFESVCRGAAFGGFEYGSERGARAPELRVEGSGVLGEALQDFRCYYNGGGVFVDADKVEGVQVLARYSEKLNVEGGDAAVVYCKVGRGGAVLTGPHPEFAAVNLDRNAGPEGYSKLVDALLEDDTKRVAFLRACLVKLGLNITGDGKEVPPLSDIHLSSINPANVGYLVERLKEITTTTEDGIRKIIGENDTFTISNYKEDALSLTALSLPAPKPPTETGILDHNALEKQIKTHLHAPPPPSETPHFSHKFFYSALAQRRAQSFAPVLHRPSHFGSYLLYANVTTSTNTILDKNFTLLQRLPTGLTAVATIQVSGRGRGSNSWVTPLGALVWSTVIRHAAHLGTTAPVVFIQYLVALAVVEAIKSYGDYNGNGEAEDEGYAAMPVRLKWPNDIYAADPASASASVVKIGGILVNCSYADGQFLLVVGVGLNTTNAAPTTSLNHLLAAVNVQRAQQGRAGLAPYEAEPLLARILARFEEMYALFCERGFAPFMAPYYEHWLHSGQVVTLEMEGGARARVRGITSDFGLLVVDEVDAEGRGTGRTWTLQSDGNSFDFFRGLLRKKT